MIEVGDLVQVEIGGAFCFPDPVRVTDVIPHGEDTYVFVEGSMSAVLLENIVRLTERDNPLQ